MIPCVMTITDYLIAKRVKLFSAPHYCIKYYNFVHAELLATDLLIDVKSEFISKVSLDVSKAVEDLFRKARIQNVTIKMITIKASCQDVSLKSNVFLTYTCSYKFIFSARLTRI
jgi:hypothetical protein